MREKLGRFLPYTLLGLSLLLVVCLNLFCHDHWLDSDMAAEMIFSRQLAEGGHFFATPDWYYSTEFRFLYTHWIMGPLFRVLGSWHVIRMITNLLSYVLMLWAYFYFMRPLKVQKSLVTATAVLLILPFSETMMTHMVMGNTYMFHVIIVLFFFGLYLRLTGTGEKWRVVWNVAYLALALICGVSGVRYLLALQCPLVLTAFCYMLRSVEFQQLRRELHAGNGREQWKKLAGSISAKYFGYSIFGAAGSLAGYAINVLYVSRQYVFQTYDATNFIPIYQGVLMERVQNAIGSLLMLFGYIPDRSVLSLRGLITIIAFVLTAVFVYSGVQAWKESKGQRMFVTLFLAVSFFLNLFVFVFTTSTMVPRYYLTIFVFVLPVLCFYLEKEERYFDRAAVCLILVACLGLATGKTVLSYLSVDKNADKRAVADFLEKNDHHFGYATYWNANIITELTDGRVEIANLNDVEKLEYFKWSSPMKYYEEDYADGAVFLLLSAEELATSGDTEVVKNGAVVYADGAYTVLLYDSARTLFGLAGGR